jgi:uncharacterized protein YjbJ (UPF0337 family)
MVTVTVLPGGWSAGRLIQINIQRGSAMNKDQVKGTVMEVAGKLVGSTEQRVKGHILEAEGKAHHGLGDAKSLVMNVSTKS